MSIYSITKKLVYVSAFICSVFLPFAFAMSVQAATLSIAPISSKISVGNIVSVNVVLGTNGVAVNTANATIQFPTDLLEVMSVSKSSSVFSLWVQDPTYSNTTGTITFTGGVPTPGYVGQNGNVMSVVFRAKKQGNASIIFSDAAVLQNDGLGTNVLTSEQPGAIEIGSAAVEVPAVTTQSNSLPALPVITSSTHPHQDAWYSGTSASFSWNIPNDVTSIQTLLSQSATAVPTVTYDSSVSQRTVNNLTDGILYFHLRYMNSVGWGPTATYKVQIDSTPPEKFALNVATQNNQNLVTLNAVDAMSGIDSYSVKIDDAPALRVDQSALVNNQYTLPVQNQGSHTLAVVAYDRAGNSTESDTTFISPMIIPPVLTSLPQQITRGEALTLQGMTQYPNSPVIVYVQPEGKAALKYVTTTGVDGSFSTISDPLQTSVPTAVWAQLVFSDSIRSTLSQTLTVLVNDPLIVQSSKSLMYMLSFALPATLLLLVLLFSLYVGWHKFFGLRKRMRTEVQETLSDSHRALMLFKDELNRQLNQLEKIKEDRDLNRKEEKIFKNLRDNVDSIHEFIEKKLKKIR